MIITNEKHNKKMNNIRKIWLFIIEYSYIFLIIHIIGTIISVYISLHCNNFFSIETIVACFFPYIYLPFRYYLKDNCNMPTKMCFRI